MSKGFSEPGHTETGQYNSGIKFCGLTKQRTNFGSNRKVFSIWVVHIHYKLI